MHRYIVFAWNPRLAERNSLAKTLVRRLEPAPPGWGCALATEGLQVYQAGRGARPRRAYSLGGDAGVVLGTVFARRAAADSEPREAVFDERETQKVRETGGRHLVEHYWGGYVALLRDDSGTRVRILRDPTGAIPCLLTGYRGIHVVCSHIEDCAALGTVGSSIDWDHVAAFLSFERLVTSDTGLAGVRQIHAGECVTVDTESVNSEFYWEPHRIHDARTMEDRRPAMRELRDVIRHCVVAWATGYGSVLHSLSGGLDSAVVLACLSSAADRMRLICQNHFMPATQGDERPFARKAAERAGVELIETRLRSAANSLGTMFDSRKLATPAMTYPVTEGDLTTETILRRHGIEAVFSGQGGDHFFQQASTRLIAADYARRRGLRPGIADVVVDTSRFTRRPVWSVMFAAFNYGLLRRHPDPYARRLNPPLLLNDAARDALDPDSVRHPWAVRASDLPAGKICQIVSIIDTQNFHHQGPSNHADVVHPLISQPIIELCLQIPSYVLTYGGRDRALVRDAFSDMLPSEIAARTTKGATTAYANGVLVANLAAIRTLLLDGVLVSERLLDERKTEASLRESRLIRDPDLYWPVLNAVRAESWLRAWLA